MTSLRMLPRVLRIAALLVRYRLDDVIDDAHRFRMLRWARLVVPRARAEIAALPRGERLVFCFPAELSFQLSTMLDLRRLELLNENNEESQYSQGQTRWQQ